ncbi:hypothetical protein Bca4012_062356 [Brassica carinata]|uniref:DUF4283 domain-containing protein n=1 Tax=Brassica carinata TaxID=52824 RepID=A0A8X7SCE0_BRACI|nr:hypothetical protein Bca52824_032269 [Brassica carinata]
MSAAMDRALMALSLEQEEEDVPFTMPDLPGFSSAEENAFSIIGRTLYPKYQKISGLILTMPRKWKKEGKVRGVALSEEKFQFIFQTEHDLMDVLEQGVHTYNEWPMVLERWMENPPEDYLQFIPLWVQISKIRENYYTLSALTSLGEMLGEVKLVAFDPTKPITQPFIRVQVSFNVANPLRMAKVLNKGEGKTHTIHFDYERIQKLCFTCKRMNHEKSICPWEVKKHQDEAQMRRERIVNEKSRAITVLKQNDPLFGVLEEDQVGPDPLTGRPKIAKEVLEEMRRFLVADTGEALALKIDKVKKSVQKAERDPIAQKIVLRLESVPLLTSELNKGKGHVLDYGEKELERSNWDLNINPNKLMAASMRANRNMGALSAPLSLTAAPNIHSDGELSGAFSDCSTVFRAGFSEPGSFGTGRRKAEVRRRPPRTLRQRNLLPLTSMEGEQGVGRREGKQEKGSRKRKKTSQGVEDIPNNKAQCLKVIPHEGSPSSQ